MNCVYLFRLICWFIQFYFSFSFFIRSPWAAAAAAALRSLNNFLCTLLFSVVQYPYNICEIRRRWLSVKNVIIHSSVLLCFASCHCIAFTSKSMMMRIVQLAERQTESPRLSHTRENHLYIHIYIYIVVAVNSQIHILFHTVIFGSACFSLFSRVLFLNNLHSVNCANICAYSLACARGTMYVVRV